MEFDYYDDSVFRYHCACVHWLHYFHLIADYSNQSLSNHRKDGRLAGMLAVQCCRLN